MKDVADLLNVSEKTIYRMIQNETIPCFRVGGQWRFDRREIASWLEDTRAFSVNTAVDSASGEDEESLLISELLRRGGIYYQVSGKSKNEAILASLELIRKTITHIDVPKLFASILQRESLCSTAVGNAIALPHPKSFGIFTELSYIALCFLERPIPFGSLDNEDVETLFFVFPKSERRFLRIQSKLSRLLKDDQVMSVLKRTAPAEEIFRVFSAKETEIFGAGAGK